MYSSKVFKKGQLVIPSKLRKKYDIKEGTIVEFLDLGDQIILIPLPDNPIERAEGWLKFKKTVKEVLDENRKEEEKFEKAKKVIL
ncbi:MAG: AbrB/MazE/SpoVT family DNA-binding domain-containing protein [Acidobacteriota bacterium]